MQVHTSKRKRIDIDDFSFDPKNIKDKWLLLCAGDFSKQHFNAMTISWASYGQLWNTMFFQVFVRPTRFTYEFMEQYDTFTLSMFDKSYRDSLSKLGTLSGRNTDKISLAGLTPEASLEVSAPSFAEASLVIECKKIYFQDFDPSHFLDPKIEENYPEHDYHRVYYGKIEAISLVEYAG